MTTDALLVKLSSIVRALASVYGGDLFKSGGWNVGLSCVLCGAEYPRHRRDCPWVLASEEFSMITFRCKRGKDTRIYSIDDGPLVDYTIEEVTVLVRETFIGKDGKRYYRAVHGHGDWVDLLVTA